MQFKSLLLALAGVLAMVNAAAIRRDIAEELDFSDFVGTPTSISTIDGQVLVDETDPDFDFAKRKKVKTPDTPTSTTVTTTITSTGTTTLPSTTSSFTTTYVTTYTTTAGASSVKNTSKIAILTGLAILGTWILI